jgi:hypothetical protein
MISAGVALADSPHFISSSDTIDGDGNLLAKFKEAGLGNTPISFSLTADTSFLFQCFTKSNNKPQGAPNAGGPSTETTETTITPRNGQITATIEIDVVFPPPTVTCKGNGLKLCLVSASYDNVVLTDTTDSVSVSLADASLAAKPGGFLACVE